MCDNCFLCLYCENQFVVMYFVICNIYAKIQKPSEMAKFILTFPQCNIFTSRASKVRKELDL